MAENIEKTIAPFLSGELDDIIHNLDKEGNTRSERSSNGLKEISVKLDQAIEQVEDIFHFVRATQKIPLAEVKQNIIPAIQHAAEVPHLFHLFSELQSSDDYTYRHNIGVGVIATLIGKWLNLSKGDLEMLTIAATLHDIGKTKIPLKILNKPGKLTKEEYEVVKKHTVYGYNLLKNTEELRDEISLVALQHHEREDGGGYPFGLNGNKINYFAKIVAVADVFHAMSSNRVYHDATPFYQVIKQMNDSVFGQLDPSVLIPFLTNIMESVIGHKVVLNDGRVGIIILNNQFNLLKPLVKVGETIVDLNVNNSLYIERIISN